MITRVDDNMSDIEKECPVLVYVEEFGKSSWIFNENQIDLILIKLTWCLPISRNQLRLTRFAIVTLSKNKFYGSMQDAAVQADKCLNLNMRSPNVE